MQLLSLPSLSFFPKSSLQFQPHNSFSSRRCSVRCASTSGDGDGDSFTAKSGYLFELSAKEADSLADYSISKIAAIYYRKPVVVARRLFQTGIAFGKWFGLRYLDSLFERSDDLFQVRAAELRKILVELGPAYIKIAQAISSRADLIPPSYLDELSLLQDRISPFSTEVAFNMIEQELGLSLVELFSEISPEPVAAASLGQVYQARLRKTGQVVAVKVQRPGVQAAISLDILILRLMAGLIRRVGKLNTDLQAVVDEWASSLFRLDPALKLNIGAYLTPLVRSPGFGPYCMSYMGLLPLHYFCVTISAQSYYNLDLQCSWGKRCTRITCLFITFLLLQRPPYQRSLCPPHSL